LAAAKLHIRELYLPRRLCNKRGKFSRENPLQQAWKIFKSKTFATSVANFKKIKLCNKRGKFQKVKPLQQAWQILKD
jgi:hypothetical protein